MPISPQHITGVILAGGRSQRMGGADKGLLTYRHKPLIAHVITRLSSQVSRLAINANRHIPEYQQFGHPVFSDQDADYAGPLAGLAAAWQQVDSDWIVTVPTDAPNLPADLVSRLVRAVHSPHIHVASCLGDVQPVFALWPRQSASALLEFLASGKRAVHEFLQQQHAVNVDFSDQPQAFRNINTPDQLLSPIQPCPVLGVVGWSGCGKTTLLKQLIPLLNASGLRLGLLKHAHHQFDIDIPGKDSYELRKAGAQQVLVASQQRWALMTETPQRETDPELEALLTHLDREQLDLILVEGFKHAAIAKIEVHRAVTHQPLLCTNDADIIAVATDVVTLEGVTTVVLDLNNPTHIAGFIRTWVLDQTQHASA